MTTPHPGKKKRRASKARLSNPGAKTLSGKPNSRIGSGGFLLVYNALQLRLQPFDLAYPLRYALEQWLLGPYALADQEGSGLGSALEYSGLNQRVESLKRLVVY